MVTEQTLRRPDALPAGFACAHINEYGRTRRPVARFFGSAADGPQAKDWFHRIDAVLRSAPEADQLLPIVQAVQELCADAGWNDLLLAVARDARDVTRKRRAEGRLRSLWGITPIISLRHGVSADRRLGVEAESLVFTTYYVTGAFDINLSEHLNIVKDHDPGSMDGFHWMVLLWAMFSYDIFYFYNDRGILLPQSYTGRYYMGIRREELALLRRAEKYIYTMPYGADYRTRIRTMEGSPINFCTGCPEVGQYCFCNDEVWPTVFYPIAAYATAVLGSGLALRQLPRVHRIELVVNDTDAVQPAFPTVEKGRKVHALHVPNHPHFKGTKFVEAAMQRLEQENEAIELTLASGIGNDEVIALMKGCDLVIDQLIGGHFGQTALEALALGKPTIVYLSDPALALAPDECPIINATPDTIYDVLKSIAQSPAQLEEIGRRSRRYVEKYYSIGSLSGRLRDLYRETAGLQFAEAQS